ncbi:MAG: type IX secretion system sortase PorU [Bacteroidales bacterium]|nr:type IX secretion system sortase PorU [Bacteroidales bacterium]
MIIGKVKYFHALLAISMLIAGGEVLAQEAGHSLLSSGVWWKATITESGVYRVSGTEINNMIGTPTADIAVYGYDGSAMPTTHSFMVRDDLEEMAVAIDDRNGNGVFEAEDGILFYAQGPVSWQYNTTLSRLSHSTNTYCATNYVFITSSSGSHKRIATIDAEPSEEAPVTTCYASALHEKELTNTHKSGQIWVGERFFGGSTSQDFTITLPTQATGTVKIRYALASVSTAASRFIVNMNGSTRNFDFNGQTVYNTFEAEYNANGTRTLNINIEYKYSESMASGYIDYIEVEAPVTMGVQGSQTTMYTAPASGIKKYNVANGAGCRIWDITDYNNARELTTTAVGSAATFCDTADKWRTYIAFNGNTKTVQSISAMNNQDIHGADSPELVIVCHSALKEQALRLANIHSINDNMYVLVVTQEEVFNEFGGGQRDPMAIREMMMWFRQRALNNTSLTMPRHLLIFGKGTYDNRNIMGNTQTTVVTYETPRSFDEEGMSIATDDVMANLVYGTTYNTPDISVGRLPAKNEEEARHLVDKIERYITRPDLTIDNIRGDWRNSVALLADDADPGNRGDTSFTASSEFVSRNITKAYPHITIDKIYADSYVQQSGADGSFYPDVNNALRKRLNYGCLILNYIGHGSAQYIGTERFMMKSDISTYKNLYQLPFFITSTCTFGRYDDPDETCGAEEFLLADGAGIACLAASRPISHVESVNNDMIMESLNPNNTIGDAVRITKSRRVTTQALTLLGDPALKLSHPKYNVVVTAINGHEVDSNRTDSALVLSTVTIEGEIRDNDGGLVADFDGKVYPEVYDRISNARTLANDNDGCEVAYLQQNKLIYKGSAPVRNGKFSYRFTVPKDVNYKFDYSRISHYAKSATEDAAGAYTNLMLGGFDESVDISETRPQIRLFMNDTSFINGGITDDSPTLLALLYDTIGINAVGSGLGHDMMAVLDGNTNNTIILNDFYETDIDDCYRGRVTYTLSGLSRGRHTLKFRAWNIFNYSNNAEITFYVRGTDTVSTSFNAAPNPASDRTILRMEHNLKGKIENIRLEIFNMQGSQVIAFNPTPLSDSYVAGPVEWNLRDIHGRRVAPGIYIARFTVTTSDGERIDETGKIVVR